MTKTMAQVLETQELVQEFTAEQIMPLWTNYIAHGMQISRAYPLTGGKINIHDSAKCVVGEAWGFHDMYTGLDGTCDTCASYALTFCHRSYDPDPDCNSELSGIDEFVTHMNECHRDMLIKRLKIELA